MDYSFKDIADRRGFKRIVHFHCDHFEPESWVNNRNYDWDKLRRLLSVEFNWSAFTRVPFPAITKQDRRSDHVVLSESSDDEVLFLEWYLHEPAYKVFELIGKLGVDLHVHMHHEYYTITEESLGNRIRYRRDHGLSLDESYIKLRKWVDRYSTSVMDGKRFSRYLNLSLSTLKNITGENINNWAFIHGCWALNGADPIICNIENEIQILQDAGCIGDFTFPAGRRNCDPKIQHPFTVVPQSMLRSFDHRVSRPELIDGVGIDKGRFLIWNSSRNSGWNGSLDYRSDATRAKLEANPILGFVQHDMPVIGETGYIKTHAHSMHLAYWQHGVSPLQWSRWLFERLQCDCDEADIEFCQQSVRQVYDELR